MNGTANQITVQWQDGRDSVVRRASAPQIVALIEVGEIDENTLVAVEGQGWKPAGQVDEFAEVFEQVEVPRRARRLDEMDIDLAPMIDVTFLLLLFFMFTATYERQKTIDTPVPPSESAVVRPTREELEQDNIVAEVDAAGTLRLDKTLVAWGDLRSEIERHIRERRTTKLLIIAEDVTDWEYVVRLQDEANLAGIERIGFGKPVQANGP